MQTLHIDGQTFNIVLKLYILFIYNLFIAILSILLALAELLNSCFELPNKTKKPKCFAPPSSSEPLHLCELQKNKIPRRMCDLSLQSLTMEFVAVMMW